MADRETLAHRAAALLTGRRETIAISESAAGGLIAAALVAVPGASACFLGGAVVYTAHARQGLLGLGPAEMEGLRSATEPYARLAAASLRERVGADWVLAETGASGPTGNRYGDPAGHCCLAVAGPRDASRTLRTGSSDRAANMEAFAAAALTLLVETLDPA